MSEAGGDAMTNAEENARDQLEDIAARHMLDGVERGEAERMTRLQLRELRQRDRHRPRGPDGMILLGETER